MSDMAVIGVIVGLSLLSWGLLILCERLQGGA